MLSGVIFYWQSTEKGLSASEQAWLKHDNTTMKFTPSNGMPPFYIHSVSCSRTGISCGFSACCTFIHRHQSGLTTKGAMTKTLYSYCITMLEEQWLKHCIVIALQCFIMNETHTHKKQTNVCMYEYICSIYFS